MSVQVTLDLRAKASPRSLSVFAASEAEQGRVNPFDRAPSSFDTTQHALAIVSGTERGSLHYRTFSSPKSSSSASRGGLSASIGVGASSTATGLSGKLQLPLGLATSQRGTTTSNLPPREYFPVDLTSLPGSVVSAIKLSTGRNNSLHFLLLIDDNRGSSLSQPGQYAALMVTLAGGTFHVHPTTSSLPRISCALYHPITGLVYGSGRNIASLGPEHWEEEVKTTKRGSSRYASSSNRWKRLVFGKNALPAPGVRSGQDAMTLASNGRVAVVAVGNSFYAVAGQEVDERQQGPLQTTECIKILSFAQSSQVHPVIILDLQDDTLDSDWSSLVLASGRECAVVDLYFGPPSAPSLSYSKPRQGSVALASPILAAAASNLYVVVLTSDGLISVRSPSCLAVALSTVRSACMLRVQPGNGKFLTLVVCLSISRTLILNINRSKSDKDPTISLSCAHSETKRNRNLGLWPWLTRASAKCCSANQTRRRTLRIV